jgi:hypothetical protein
MKKFTTLKEDLLNEAMESKTAFEEGYNNATEKIEKIKIALENFKEQFELDPRNWGFAGSMGRINEQLDDILGFLNNE